MKNQYFGDVNDFRKYGLLRILAAIGGLRVGVLWLLMPDDGRSDGEFRRYLAQPARWRHFDVELFDHLSRLIDTNATRSVDHAADWDLFPAARFFAEVVPVGRHARRFLLGLAKTEETQRYATSR